MVLSYFIFLTLTLLFSPSANYLQFPPFRLILTRPSYARNAINRVVVVVPWVQEISTERCEYFEIAAKGLEAFRAFRWFPMRCRRDRLKLTDEEMYVNYETIALPVLKLLRLTLRRPVCIYCVGRGLGCSLSL